MKKVIHIFHIPTSFTGIDGSILSKRYEVLSFSFHIKNVVSIPLLMFKQILFLFRELRKSEFVFCMFAGYHTLWPVIMGKLFKKPVFIVVGGIDGVCFPEVNYGNFTKFFLRIITTYSFKNCTHLLPISEYLEYNEYQYTPVKKPLQGIRSLVPSLKTPVTVVYNGFKTDLWFSEKKERPINSFLAIAFNIGDPVRSMIKGFDIIIDVATLVPEAEITVIGFSSKGFKQKIPDNVKILPPVEHHKLREIYNKHRFFLQLSMSEGFGNTLAEAMLCECIPIGSSAGAIPMIIADYGYILKEKNPAMLASLFHKAMSENNEIMAKNARNRILENYRIELRSDKLYSVFEKYV